MSGYAPNSMRMLSWNMAHREAHWHDITNDSDLDVALLQEAVPPPSGCVLETIPPADARWVTAGGNRRFCAAIARLSDRVTLRPIRTTPLADAGRDELAVSLPGTLAACEVILESGEPITVASIYGAWTSPIPWKEGGWIYADASVHRLISDLSALVASQRGHRIIVAGDLNILHGHGEQGNELLAGPLSNGVHADGGDGTAVRRATAPQRRTVLTLAGRTAERQQERTDVSHSEGRPFKRYQAARFRVCVD